MPIACRLLCVLLVACLLGAPAAAQTTWYVDVNATPPGNGSQATPYTSVQHAIDQQATLSGDTILILPGVYYERIDLRAKSLELQGTFGAAVTILDGGLGGYPTNPSEDASVLTMRGVGVVRLTNLTIRNGFGNPHPITERLGGGVYAETSKLTITSCIIRQNLADYSGGGVYFNGDQLEVYATVIEDNFASTFGAGMSFGAQTCTIEDSTIASNGFPPGGGYDTFRGGGLSGYGVVTTISDTYFINNVASCYGGGMDISAATLSIDNCTFEENHSLSYVKGAAGEIWASASATISNSTFKNNTSGLDGHAGALSCLTMVTLQNCLFEGNGAHWTGGAILGDVNAQNCIFRDNSAGSGGAVKGGGSYVDCLFEDNFAFGTDNHIGYGGALHAEDNPLLIRCLFLNNASIGGYSLGGATYGECRLFNCTVVGNSALDTAGGCMGGTLTNCIVWNNQPNSLGGNAVATYSDIQGGWPGSGNLNMDPLFWGAPWGDLHLRAGSPCIDAGSPNSPPDPDGSIADMGAYPFDPNYCPGPATYCAPKVNLLGCSPSMSFTGTPTISGPDDFTIHASNLTSIQAGMLIWGQGSSAMPFYGGTLCVQPPVIRAGIQNSGGNTQQFDCSGSFSFHFSQAYMSQQLLSVGTTLYAQYWMRDVADPVGLNVGLTDGLRFSVCP